MKKNTKSQSDETLTFDLTNLLKVIRGSSNPDHLPTTTLGRKVVFDCIIAYAVAAKELLEVREGVRKGTIDRMVYAAAKVASDAAHEALEQAEADAKSDHLDGFDGHEPDMEDVGEDTQLLPEKFSMPTAEPAQKAPDPVVPTTVGPAKETTPDPPKDLFQLPVKGNTRAYSASEKLAIRDEILRGIKHKGVQARLIRHYNLSQGAVSRMKTDPMWLANMQKAAGLDKNGLPAPKAGPYDYTPDEKLMLAMAYRAIPYGHNRRVDFEKRYHASPATFTRWYHKRHDLRILSAVEKGDPDHPDVPAELMNIEPRAKVRDYTNGEKAVIGKEYRYADNLHTMGMQVAIATYYGTSCNSLKYWSARYPTTPLFPAGRPADLGEALDFGPPSHSPAPAKPRKRPACRLCGLPGHNAINCKVMPQRMALVHDYIHLKNRDAPGIRNEWLVRHNVSLEMLQDWAARYKMGYTVR